MLVAKRRELLHRAPQIKGTGGLQRRHQHAFFRGEDFCGFAHKAHTGDQNGLGRVSRAKAGHLQGIGHTAAGFFGQGLNHRITIKVRHQHCVAGFELGGDLRPQAEGLSLSQRLGLLGIKVGLNQKSFRNLRHVRKTCKRCCAKVECTTSSGPSSPAGRMYVSGTDKH